MGAKPKNTRSAAKGAAKTTRKASTAKAPARRTPAKRTPATRAAARSGGTTGKVAAAKPVRNRGGSTAGATVDAYLASLTGWQKDAAARLSDVIRAAAP